FALLTPEIAEQENMDDEESSLTLDDSQKQAAEVPKGPQLVDAGPGTGKTRTLVGRVLFLLASGVSPKNILVLTFSNKASEELRDRLDRFAPGSTGILTIETFHSFGLELLRKYGEKIGLPAKIEIIDPVEAILFLEQVLPELDLDHYQYLPEPSKHLPDIAKAISRAKDENASPEHYLDLAMKQREKATTQEEIELAEKSLEIARVYRIYEEKLAERHLIDLGDLICRSIQLLSTRPEVLEDVRSNFTHVLVDEYQDVNRASGLLLKEVVGDGTNLWAVGDLRQSIHRWRGATTANIRRFQDDFPSANDSFPLAKNYRSRRGIVEVFSTFAPQMGAASGREFKGWEIHHQDLGSPSVEFHSASDPEAESMGIASEILRLHETGIRYSHQAVICRTHIGMARVANVLSAVGIPILYMGDLFERPEIRDLLAVLALASGPDGSGLVRVARCPEYNIALSDVMTVIKGCREKNFPFPSALNKIDEIDGVSEVGRQKLKLIADHLAELTYGRSAWKCLTRYLFERSGLLDTYLTDSSPAGQQRRLAIYQFLQFVHSRIGAHKAGSNADPKRELLRYIRHLEIFGDEKQLREPDEWARAIDAVRIMTIHASKGLEFKAVFVPGLYKGNIPNTSNRVDKCPAPIGLLSENEITWRDDEEECLFFVAMSRAREKLYLSRPLTRSSKNSNPSDFLTMIGNAFPGESNTQASWASVAPDANGTQPFQLPQPAREDPYRRSQLELYMKCPLSYFYQYVCGLSGNGDDTAYLQFHRTVYKTVKDLKAIRDNGEDLSEERVNEAFTELWQENGPTDHFLADMYEVSARQMVANAVDLIRNSDNPTVSSHELIFNGGSVAIDFDLAEVDNAGKGPLVIRRFKTGRQTKTEADKEIYGLLIRAAYELSGGGNSRVETLYLRDNSSVPVLIKPRSVETRLAKYEGAIKGISEGDFYPIESDYNCPRCPHYFICPAAN
ncbi:MAG: ATP-dependent helicase, partial [Pyrinomonadaceae bacterium]